MAEPVTFGLVAFWLAFASKHSGLPIPPTAAMPVVEMVSSAELNQWPLPRSACGQKLAGKHDSGTIKISTGMARADTECTLAHEFVHWLQMVNRFPPVNLEPLAYKVEGICYDQHFHLPNAAAWSTSRQQESAGDRCP